MPPINNIERLLRMGNVFTSPMGGPTYREDTPTEYLPPIDEPQSLYNPSTYGSGGIGIEGRLGDSFSQQPTHTTPGFNPELPHPMYTEANQDNPMAMQNVLNFIRMQNLFDPNRVQEAPFEGSPVRFGQSEEVSAPMPRERLDIPESEGMDLESRARELFNPQMRAQDRSWDMINNMPTRDQYKPSVWRNIGAGIVGGFHGPQAGSQFRDKPFNQATSDWKMRFDPLSKVADDERLANNQQRQFTQSLMIDDAKQKALESRERNQAEGRRLEQARIDFQKYKQDHPNLKFDMDSNGNLIALNPADGRAMPVLGQSGEPIKGSDLTDAQRLEHQLKNAQSLEGTRQRNRLAIQDDDQAFDREITNILEAGRNKRDNGPSSGSNGNVQLEVTRARLNKARELQARGNKWVKVQGDEIIIKKPGMFSKKEEEVERQKAVDAIYGSTEDSKNIKQEDKLKVDAVAPKAPPGWKYVRNAANTGWTAVQDKK